MTENDIKELKELMVLNLRLNTVILSGLASSKEYTGLRRDVVELLKKAKSKIEEFKGK